MGMDHIVYVGPYIKYEMPKKTEIEFFYACPKKGCTLDDEHELNEDNFCPKCGCKIKKLSNNTVVDKFDLWDDFLEPFNETLVPAGEYVEDVLMPNRKGHGQSFDYCDAGCFDLDEEGELEKFNKIYAKEISTLTKQLDNVEVRWGVICYAN